MGGKQIPEVSRFLSMAAIDPSIASHARGESTPESDVDLCIVTNGSEAQQSAARTLRRAIGRIRNKPALSLVPISQERLAEKRRIRDPFYETILREGVCLAEKD